jgi:hypothetical protein
MTKYIIKATYLEGDHAGREYYLDKQGYVVSNIESVWQDSSYTLSACKAVCTKKEKSNNAEVIFEKRERARKIAEGKTISRRPLYIMTRYEPFAIETVDR